MRPFHRGRIGPGVLHDPIFEPTSAKTDLVALDSFNRLSAASRIGNKPSCWFDVRLRKFTQVFDLAWIFPLP